MLKISRILKNADVAVAPKKPKMVKKKCPKCMGKGTIPGSYLKCKECKGEGTLQAEYSAPVATKCPGCGDMVTTKSGFCPSCNKERNNARYSSVDHSED